jgi:hypothetical protein
LLPESDPPYWPTVRLFFWSAVLVAGIAIAGAAVVGGVVEPWEGVGAVALGTAAWFIGLRTLKRAKGTRADDTSLRDEIRQWQNGPRRH